jgi:hypothetical protein
MPTPNNNPVTVKFWETEQRRPSEKMVGWVRLFKDLADIDPFFLKTAS